MTMDFDYKNSEIEKVIDEYIHSERDRQVLKYRYIDGYTYEKIAELMDLSVRQTKTIVYKQGDRVMFHMKHS